jgi:hypothetical protein
MFLYFALSCLRNANGFGCIAINLSFQHTDGDRKIYEPLTKLSLDVNSPWYVFKHCICAYHMIDKLFKTKVSVNNKNKAFVEYAKRWVKSWCNSLDTEE